MPSGVSLPVATTSVLGGVKSDGSTVSIAGDGTLSVVTIAVSALTAVSGGAKPGDLIAVNRAISGVPTDFKLGLSDPWTFGKTVRTMPVGVSYASGGNAIDLSTGNTFYLGATASVATDGTPTVTGTTGNVALTFTGIAAAAENQEFEIYIFHGSSVGTVTISGSNVHWTGGATSYTVTAPANGVTLLAGKVINQSLGLTGMRWT